MSELPENNEEDDEARYPAVELVHVYNLVAKERDEEGAGGDDDNTSVPWHVTVDSVEKLRADYDIDTRPTYAGKAIENGN